MDLYGFCFRSFRIERFTSFKFFCPADSSQSALIYFIFDDLEFARPKVDEGDDGWLLLFFFGVYIYFILNIKIYFKLFI